MEKTKKDSQVELAEAYTKNEEYKKEIKQWEVMYKEWMTMMEDRVSNINRTHEMLQVCIELLLRFFTLNVRIKFCSESLKIW